MVKQYPDLATWDQPNTPGGYDENGDAFAAPTYPAETSCRVEFARAPVIITGGDSTQIRETCVLYFPYNATVPTPGMKISVYDRKRNFLFTKVVTRNANDQLNCRVWV